MDSLFFNIERKVTEVFSCRLGDFFIHVRCKNIFTGEFTIIDLWEVKNGDYVTFTNRYEDFPVWFKIHPTEVKGVLSNKLLDEFNNIIEKQGGLPAPMDEANIWKARTGDYIAWIGDSRNNMKSVNGILKIFNIREDTLIYGEPRIPEDIYLFGDPLNFNREDYKEKRESCRIAFKLIQQQGIPREISEIWRVG